MTVTMAQMKFRPYVPIEKRVATFQLTGVVGSTTGLMILIGYAAMP